jgi:c-di-GMP-binding flagellar brake protein YcgR
MAQELEQERRQFFRVEDEVSLRYQVVKAGELEVKLKRLEQDLDSDFTIVSSLAAISHEMAGVLRKVESDAPDVARYLKALDRKIDLLGRAFLAQTSDLSEQPAKAVNMSASGLAFYTPEPVAVGGVLELKLLLFPSYTGMLIYAEVVACERVETAGANGFCRIRVNFTHLRESDRDVLIRHVLQRQSEMLRRQREEREPSA